MKLPTVAQLRDLSRLFLAGAWMVTWCFLAAAIQIFCGFSVWFAVWIYDLRHRQ